MEKIKAQVTVVIHTRNEEKHISDCIESARLLTDTIVVVDMESTDRTRERAEKARVAVRTFPFSHYVEPAREFGIKQAAPGWVCILDADERMTEELAHEIQKIISNQPQTETYYKIPRKNIFGGPSGKWLKHGGWWPDYQIRLINTKHFKEWPKQIHSTPQIEGVMGYLNNPLLHYFHGDLEEMVRKTLLFEDIESDLLLKAGRTAHTITFFRKFFGELFRRLIRDRGFMDGTIGIIESIYQAYSKTITYLFLYEKKHHKKSRSL